MRGGGVKHGYHADGRIERMVLCWSCTAAFLELVSLLCHHPCSVIFCSWIIHSVGCSSMATVSSD